MGVSHGESPWTAAQIQRIQRDREIEARWGQLTEREREVLKWMAQGWSNKEIAQALGLTVRAVEFHVGNILQKLGVVSRLEAVRWVREHGFLPGQGESGMDLWESTGPKPVISTVDSGHEIDYREDATGERPVSI